MNPSGQPQPGQQTNLPPQQPTQPGAGPFPPAANPYAQPTQQSQTPASNGWQQQPYPQAQQPGDPWAQPVPASPYAQPGPQQPYGAQPAGPVDYSADYLDQIAPGPSGPKLLSGNFTWIIIGLAVVFMFAVGILALSNGGNNTATAQSAYLRIDNLIVVTDNYRRFLKSSNLSSTNTNFKIFLTGAKTDLIDPLTKNGVDLTKIDKEAKTKEKDIASALTAKLEDARLNAILDRVYAREMAYQGEYLLEQYNKMGKNQSPLIADNAKKAIPNLQPLQKSFADFKETD